MDSSIPDRSEYEGGGVMPNTVFPKEADALTPSDKLRLQSITGQEVDSRAAPDPYFWYGGQDTPDPTYHELNARRREARSRERSRYRETPRPKPY